MNLFLIDTEEHRLVRGRSEWEYVALSYVWGRTEMLSNQRNIVSDLIQKGSLSPSTAYGRQLTPCRHRLHKVGTRTRFPVLVGGLLKYHPRFSGETQ